MHRFKKTNNSKMMKAMKFIPKYFIVKLLKVKHKGNFELNKRKLIYHNEEVP
jgi:hypothetical protein